jgi:hypothetical protein
MSALRGRSISERLHVSRSSEENTAAGIYGLIVSSSVMATSQAESPGAVDLATLITLTVYWFAERYARLVAARIHAGHRPGWRQLRVQMTTGWAIVTASSLPLAVLAALGLAGADVGVAVSWALACSTALLCLAGWEIGRSGRLSTPERLVSATVAGLFGVVTIVLKTLLH